VASCDPHESVIARSTSTADAAERLTSFPMRRPQLDVLLTSDHHRTITTYAVPASRRWL
jgi:hypothetical protein